MGKKFNFWNDVVKPLKKEVINPLGKSLKNVVSPLTGALSKKGVEKIQTLKSGGRVHAKKGGSLAILHPKEYVLPHNAKPTKSQKKIVAMNKKNMK
jgi:hypothetical protein